ncbi:type VI secretion system baseplate subunit TssF [Erwinia sorbitola]|uniref:Type VI secretion system baseplate subunit TssF n=1 Tax=Erwinia sorbitola TaxID=2681984 RepID=A0A6I6ED74_9GAMM|nr:type VI secretion system baseplate subunit TssF [Erwinia sorbitola]MTD28505.1 type VI secretion system baseplate subunit TssF [Erwinia sorbitola]QGU86618.1 type VI secretion system baseplate subunit TssF [Erwinia sorbitola]
MESFENLFRDELDYLQQLMAHQAKSSPHLSDFLPNSGDADVARLAEGFSALTARLRQKIIDDFPEITQNLLADVWHLPLRPIPSTSIIHFSPKKHSIDKAMSVPKQSQLFARHDGNTFSFQTCHDLQVEPLTLLHRELTHSAGNSRITLTFRYDGRDVSWQQARPLRLFLSEDKTLAATLMLWLEQYLTRITIQYDSNPLSIDPVVTGWEPDADNLILPTDKPDFWPLQLLPELFYLPHVHDFISLDICNERGSLPLSPGQQFAVSFEFDGAIPIRTVEGAFIMHCVPAINLYRAQTAKIDFQQDQACYTLPLPDNQLFSIHSVVSQQEPENEPGEPKQFIPISAGALAARRNLTYPQQDFFYELRRQQDAFDREQCQLVFYQYDAKPMVRSHLEYFICHYTAADKQAERLEPGMISIPGETIQSDLAVRNITPVTPYYPVMIKTLWPLLSLLQLNTFYFNDINAIKALLKVFDLYPERNVILSRNIQRSIDGLINIVARPIDRLHKGLPFRGMGITLTMDEHCYEGDGEMYKFAVALNSLFSVSQTENSFICMDVIQLHSQEQWCLPQVDGHRKIM